MLWEAGRVKLYKKLNNLVLIFKQAHLFAIHVWELKKKKKACSSLDLVLFGLCMYEACDAYH